MKDMLSEKDVRRIGVEMGKVLEDNIMPQLDAMHDEITAIKASMVTKDYLDDKLGDLRGEFALKQRG